jgi:hypothetical protein
MQIWLGLIDKLVPSRAGLRDTFNRRDLKWSDSSADSRKDDFQNVPFMGALYTNREHTSTPNLSPKGHF